MSGPAKTGDGASSNLEDDAPARSEHRRFTAARRCVVLTAATAVAALALAGIAWAVDGRSGVAAVGLAAAACLIPGLIAMSVAGRSKSATGTLLSIVGGMMGRMGTALGVALWVGLTKPAWVSSSFLVWLGVMYVVTLAVETPLARDAAKDASGPVTA